MENNSEQKLRRASAIVSPPPWSASAIIASSRPAAFLIFNCFMAFLVSSMVDGSVVIGRACFAGFGGSSVGPWTLFNRQLKYSFQSDSSSLSLEGGEPFIFLTLAFVHRFLPDRS